MYTVELEQRDIFACHAPDPPRHWIMEQYRLDGVSNPYSGKPHGVQVRTEIELISEYKYMLADAMIKQRMK